jgi:hypothetical protein
MAVPNDPKQAQVFDRFFCAPYIQLTRMDESPQCAEDLNIEQMRRVEIIGRERESA